MAELTDDEYTCLAITGQGQALAPIGRWRPSVFSLHAKGLLYKHDDVNYAITPAGETALAEREKADDDSIRQVLMTGNRIANARTQMQQSVEQAAQHLSFAIKAASLATGDSNGQACDQLLSLIRSRAMDLAK